MIPVLSIAVIHTQFKMGRGVDRVIYEISKRFNSLYGYDVTIFTTDVSIKDVQEINIRLLKDLSSRSYSVQLFYKFLYMYLKSHLFKGYDLLWLHSVPLLISALNIKQCYGIPILFTFHGIREVADARLLAHKVSAHLTFDKLDMIVSVSDFIKHEARKYGVKSIRIYRIYIGCDLEKFYPTWEDEGYMLYIIGELNKYKYVEIPIYVSSVHKIPLLIVGNGEKRNYLEDYANKINALVNFCGVICDDHVLVKLFKNVHL